MLIVGGQSKAKVFDSIELSNSTANACTFGLPMNDPRAQHRASVLEEKQFWFTGGKNNQGILNSVISYNTPSTVWITWWAMIAQRLAHTSTVLKNGRVLVVGGQNERDVRVEGVVALGKQSNLLAEVLAAHLQLLIAVDFSIHYMINLFIRTRDPPIGEFRWALSEEMTCRVG